MFWSLSMAPLICCLLYALNLDVPKTVVSEKLTYLYCTCIYIPYRFVWSAYLLINIISMSEPYCQLDCFRRKHRAIFVATSVVIVVMKKNFDIIKYLCNYGRYLQVSNMDKITTIKRGTYTKRKGSPIIKIHIWHRTLCPILTLSQTTNFRLFQTERVYSRQFQIRWKWQKMPQTCGKHCGKRRNCSLP